MRDGTLPGVDRSTKRRGTTRTKRKSKRTSSEQPAVKAAPSSLSNFESRLNEYANGLRERLQHLREQELAAELTKRTVQERMQDIYCGLLSELGEETCFSNKATSPPPRSPIWSDKPLRPTPDSGSSAGLSQAPTTASSLPQSCRGSAEAQTSPKLLSAASSPHRKQSGAYRQSLPWGCRSPTPSPVRQALQEALLVSPGKPRAEAIDLNSSASSTTDEDLPAEGKHISEPPPSEVPLGEFLRDELVGFQARSRPKSAPFVSEGTNVRTCTLENGFRNISSESNLSPSSEPREFIEWITRVNVFQFMDRHAAEVQLLRADVVHEVVRSLCRDAVHSLVIESLLCGP